jgi:hypothetical protein
MKQAQIFRNFSKRAQKIGPHRQLLTGFFTVGTYPGASTPASLLMASQTAK